MVAPLAPNAYEVDCGTHPSARVAFDINETLSPGARPGAYPKRPSSHRPNVYLAAPGRNLRRGDVTCPRNRLFLYRPRNIFSVFPRRMTLYFVHSPFNSTPYMNWNDSCLFAPTEGSHCNAPGTEFGYVEPLQFATRIEEAGPQCSANRKLRRGSISCRQKNYQPDSRLPHPIKDHLLTLTDKTTAQIVRYAIFACRWA